VELWSYEPGGSGLERAGLGCLIANSIENGEQIGIQQVTHCAVGIYAFLSRSSLFFAW
jgi:hypothetical protein